MRYRPWLLCIAAGALCWAATDALAQGPPRPTGGADNAQDQQTEQNEQVARAREVAEFAAREMRRYDIRAEVEAGTDADADAMKLRLVPQPVLAWSNPATGEVYGVNYFWTLNGRPAVATSVYRFFDGRKFTDMELVSLSESPLSGHRNGETVWSPPASSVTFRPLPDVPPPHVTAKARALQMRALARRFSGELVANRDDDADWTRLRLMPKPLYEYQATDASEAHGAVFGFVRTTDPEILLLIEARRTDAGSAWHYAVARMHFSQLRLSYRDRIVWEGQRLAPPWRNVLQEPDRTYRIIKWQTPADAE